MSNSLGHLTNCARCGDEIIVLPDLPRTLCASCLQVQQQNTQVPGESPLQMLFHQIRSLVDLAEPVGPGASIVDSDDLEELYETARRMAEKEGQ